MIDYRSKIERAEGQLQVYRAWLKTHTEELAKFEAEKESLEEAQAFLQQVARDTQEHLKYHIEDIVQLAIDACFPDRYEFKVFFEIKRGKTEARIALVKDGHEIDPMDASGGGVVDITAFALLVASWSLSKTDNVIVLDEPFRFVSNDLQETAARVMKELAKTLNLQFIVITHRPELVDVSDNVIEVSIENGVSEVI